MKTILFDFDGTIADTLPVVFKAFRSTFMHFLGKIYSDQDIIGLFGPPEIPILTSLIPANQHESAIQHYLQAYAEEHRVLQNPPAILSMLQSFQKAGLKLGIVTGKGRHSADISFGQLQLTSFFPIVITGDDVEAPKPHPEGIMLAMKLLEAEPQTTLYVGDSDSDIKAAKAACITSVGVNWLSVSQKTGGFTPEPDRFFTDPEEFAKWVLDLSHS